jgi:hypothetical protein
MKTSKFLCNAMMVISLTAVVSCSSDSGSDPVASLPPIGGYNNAGEVGAADLVAYWPLDGTGVESKSNTSPTNVIGATFETGIKGQGVKLTDGYMKYPSISSLTANMNAYTISAWAKVKNNQTPTSGSVSVFLSLTRPNEWEGNLNLYAETGQRPAIEASGAVNDSIVFKAGFRTSVSDGQAYENLLHLEPWMIADNLVTPNKHVANPIAVGGTWAHVVATWDGATNKFIVYINGQKSSNPAFEIRGTNTSIVFDTPTSPVIGAFGNVDTTTDTWNKPMTGSLDEIRVWKKALSAADINSLYELEKAGR